MSRIRTYARNLAANWIGYGANIAVAFFMTPFIVHSLGDVRYGVWSLIISVAGYMGLAEMGVRPSVGRYINLYMGRQQPDKINEVVNSAWAFFLGVGFVPVVLAGLIGWCFPFIFPRVSTEYLLEVRVVLMVLSVSLVLGFLSSTMWCVVTAHERFDLSNTVVVGVLAIRTAAIVLVLVYGGGLIGMALAIVGAEVVMLAISVVAARRVSKTLRFGRQWANWTCLKELMSYGVAAFVNATSQRIIYFASLLIIGWLLDASEVTYYSLGLMLVQYGRGLLGEVVRTMYPEIAKQSGKEDMAAVRWLVLRGTRVVMFFTIPVMVGFVTLGREFLVVWMGSEAYARSGTILMILALGQIAAMSADVWRNVLASLQYVRHVAALGLLEAATNLALGIVLVLWLGLGINGVAIGSLIPSAIFLGVLLPLVAAPLVGIRIWMFFWSVTARWLAAALATCGVGLAIALIPLPLGWTAISAKIIVSGLAFLLLCWLIVLRREDREPLVRACRNQLSRLGLCETRDPVPAAYGPAKRKGGA